MTNKNLDNLADVYNAAYVEYQTNIAHGEAVKTGLRAVLAALAEGATLGTSLIAQERATHPEKGFGTAHDEGHASELASAGSSYAQQVGWMLNPSWAGQMSLGHYQNALPMQWPWGHDIWKFTGDPIRDLAKAGALIAAAIDSLADGGVLIPESIPEKSEAQQKLDNIAHLMQEALSDSDDDALVSSFSILQIATGQEEPEIQYEYAIRWTENNGDTHEGGGIGNLNTARILLDNVQTREKGLPVRHSIVRRFPATDWEEFQSWAVQEKGLGE